MEKLLHFFLSKSRLNYTAFIFLIILGFISYQNIPKEVFPNLKENSINIQGHYSGTSIDTLNKIAVIKLEKNLKSIDGITKIRSYIRNGSFTIIANINQQENKTLLLDKVKSTIALVKQDLPQDMDEPSANISDYNFPLIDLTIASNKLSKDDLINIANKLKNTLLTINNISKIELFDDNKKYYEIKLDNEKIELYGLNKSTLQNEIKNLSYIFPIGEIKNKQNTIYLSTNNGAKSIQELLNTSIKIDDKLIFLSDIAYIKKDYKKNDVITYLNGKRNTQLSIYKNDIANAIELSKQIKNKIKTFEEHHPDISVIISYDDSILISKRLNTVISNILFGLLLVAAAIYILINKRVAFVVVLGIPTAILISVVIFSFTSYSINMVTLLGTLLIIGVLVDDAVIIAENIQRHLCNSEDKLQSAIQGTKEVFIPVLASSLTTIFAFIPMMVISGSLGQLLLMIPVAITILIFASLLESLVFLPIHSLHVLKTNDKELNWSKANTFYKNILLKVLKHRKKFLSFFIITIPILTVIIIFNMRYQMFLDFDEPRFTINGKLNSSAKIEDTQRFTNVLNKRLMELKSSLHIRTISLSLGEGKNSEGDKEQKPYYFQFDIELEEKIPQNFVDGIITPLLSLEKNERPKIREKDLKTTISIIREELDKIKPKEIIELSTDNKGAGITDHDIEIKISSENKEKLNRSMKKIKEKLKKIEGVVYVSGKNKLTTKELKIKINQYGQDLGFTETSFASLLSSSFLESAQTKGLDQNGIIEFITKDKEKNSLEKFKNFELNIPSENKKISLSDIATFTYTNSSNMMQKENSFAIESILADVNNDIVTASEVLSKIEPLLQELKSQGIHVSFGGEEEQNNQMKKELSKAFLISIFLIFLTLLLLFNSFKNALLVLSIIPLSILGALLGHLLMDMRLSMTSFIGMVGLAGVVINDGIVMLDFIRKVKNIEDLVAKASLRLRPIIITSVTTFLGLSTLIFFASGQAKMLQPIAVSLGFGLLWGTILTLIFIPSLFAVINKIKFKETHV